MKGRPILGITAGLLFGAFLGIALFLFGILPLTSDLLWILPLLGVLLGVAMALRAPFGKRRTGAGKPSAADDAAGGE